MGFQNTNPFYGSSGGGVPASNNQQRLAMDNLIRRELKVADPNDPKQIADALLNRFKDDPRANAITQEANGLPFLHSSPTTTFLSQAPTSSDAELQQAKNDVERDLQELLTNSLLKDVTPEIQGWAQAVRTLIQEGVNAARFALDPRQRDKAFGIRRQLGDFARVARYVGALTPTMNMTYRKFAQSLDEVASILLVLMGESLANVGFNGGRFLLQVPYTELQSRRDAVIATLRNLMGSTQVAWNQNDWPRGLDGYRRLHSTLEEQGHGDLRALLVENELSRVMDELITRADHGRADGLRALGVTAQIDLERFRRLVLVGQDLVSNKKGTATIPWSPPLSSFLAALLLFAEAFDSTGGFRLMRIARPPILFYGLYGQSSDDKKAETRLLGLIAQRNLLADQLDCFLDCGCGYEKVVCLVILDKILYDIDRSIDYYAVGTENFGIPEQRASAFGLLMETFIEKIKVVLDGRAIDVFPPQNFNKTIKSLLDKNIEDVLSELDDLLRDNGRYFDIFELGQNAKPAMTDVLSQKAKDKPSAEKYVKLLETEMCLQLQNEKKWGNLVKTMAPNCVGTDKVLKTVEALLTGTILRITGASERCQALEIKIPIDLDATFVGL